MHKTPYSFDKIKIIIKNGKYALIVVERSVSIKGLVAQ